MFYVKVLGPQGTAVTYSANGPVKMGTAIVYQSPLDMVWDEMAKAIPYGFDMLDDTAFRLARNGDGEVLPDGQLEGDPFWQFRWAVFPTDPVDGSDATSPFMCVTTPRRIYLLSDQGRTLDAVK